MNYKEKYLKYKYKYLQLKKIQLSGGASVTGAKRSANLSTDSDIIVGYKLSLESIRKFILFDIDLTKIQSSGQSIKVYLENKGISSHVLQQINGYYYEFDNKRFYSNPIICFLDYYLGVPTNLFSHGLTLSFWFKRINILIAYKLIDPYILLKQALYQLILNILYENVIRQDLYDRFITFLINTNSEDLKDTFINELSRIILYGFDKEKNMPNLDYIHNNAITQETIKSEANKILNRLNKESFKVYLLLMNYFGLANILDGSYEPVTTAMVGYLSAHKSKSKPKPE
jgi:hypothetical protein